MPTTRLHERTSLPHPIDEVFSFVADFANLAEWDPGIAASRRIDDGPLREGASFEVEAAFGSRRIPMRYEVTLFDPPHRIVLAGEGEPLCAIDDIRFSPEGEGTLVDYRADLDLRGVGGLLQPLLAPVLRRVGRRAIRGLEATLA